MCEEAEEDRDDEGENLSFVRYTVPEEPVAQVVLDDPDELFLGQEAWLWLLKDGQNELKSDDLRTDHVVADLFVTFWLFLAFDG